MLNFGLETESEGTSVLIRIRGDFDIQVVDQVTEELGRVESGEPDLLVIDLSKLSFMDSSGMAAVAAAHVRARESDRRFAIVRPPAGVRQAFDRTKFSEVVPMTDDLSKVYP